jgi:hypothetical protein
MSKDVNLRLACLDSRTEHPPTFDFCRGLLNLAKAVKRRYAFGPDAIVRIIFY